jgi:4-hydroxy-3-methylbut-2-enyl diphosphate reductase IspH
MEWQIGLDYHINENSECSILKGMNYILSDNYNNKESDGTITDNSNQELIIIQLFSSNKNSSSQNSGSSIDNKRYFQTQTTKTSTKTGEVRTNKKHSSPSQNNKKIFSIKKNK